LTPGRGGAFTPLVPLRPLCTALLAALSALGCLTTSGASSHAIPAVRVQASTDLDCPQSEIHVSKDLGGRFEAIGCGHRIVYNTGCEGLRCVVAPEGQAVPWRARPDPTPQP
jgi:hypothetical protein